MQKVYQRINWENDPSTKSPINDDNLNKMDYAIDQIDSRVVQLSGYEERVAQSEANAKTSETNAKVSEINAKESEVKAKEYMEQAFKGTPEGYQEFLDKVDKMDIATTTATTIQGTKHGGYRFNKIVANTVQNGTPSPSTPSPLLSTGDCVELMKGARQINDGTYMDIADYVCNKLSIPCKSGDVVKIKTDRPVSAIDIILYNDSGYVTYKGETNTDELEYTVASGVTKFNFNIWYSGITPQNAGKITLTINGKYLGCANTHGKNYLNPLRVEHIFIGSGLTPGKNSEYDLYEMFEVGDYVVSWGKESTGYIYIIYYDDNKKIILRDVYHTTTSPYLLIDSTKGSYFSIMHANSTATTFVVEVQLERGTVATPYEPYKETVAYYTTKYPMVKGSTLFRENGLVKAMHTSGEFAYTTDYSYYVGSYPASDDCIQITTETLPPNCMLNASLLFCSHYLTERVYCGSTIGSKINFYPPKSLYASASEFKAGLENNPIIVIYKLATPIIETLDTASQIALNSLETFDGVTYVEFDTRVQPLEFETEVGLTNETARLLKNELRNDTLEVKYNELAVAIVSQ